MLKQYFAYIVINKIEYTINFKCLFLMFKNVEIQYFLKCGLYFISFQSYWSKLQIPMNFHRERIDMIIQQQKVDLHLGSRQEKSD